jgi:hypothetical protein
MDCIIIKEIKLVVTPYLMGLLPIVSRDHTAMLDL